MYEYVIKQNKSTEEYKLLRDSVYWAATWSISTLLQILDTLITNEDSYQLLVQTDYPIIGKPFCVMSGSKYMQLRCESVLSAVVNDGTWREPSIKNYSNSEIAEVYEVCKHLERLLG